MLPLLFAVVCAVLPQGSVAALESGRLDAFLKTRGASEVGNDVRWMIPAKVLAAPERSRKGWDLYVYKGVGILIPSDSTALEEVRRRGGRACLRGRVIKVPHAGRAPKDPDYALDVRELSRRK